MMPFLIRISVLLWRAINEYCLFKKTMIKLQWIRFERKWRSRRLGSSSLVYKHGHKEARAKARRTGYNDFVRHIWREKFCWKRLWLRNKNEVSLFARNFGKWIYTTSVDLRTRSAFTGSFSASDVQNSLQIKLPDVALGFSIWHFMPRSTDTWTSVHKGETQQGDR